MNIVFALFQMHPNKAPGPDGMHALFFQSFWHIIGPDVGSYVKKWWRGEVELHDINNTCIVLILKWFFFNGIISQNRSAFVPKRLISDNALVAFEIFHAMKRSGKGKEGSFALYLDMSKAYDRVEWSFLKKISGSVTPTRGLRQGDPISPYLFLLCADAFSTLIGTAAENNLIHENMSFASGQNVNLSKTEVTFSKKVSMNRRQEIIDTLGVREVDRYEKVGRKKLLSMLGREILLKAVAQAIPIYMMSIFKILDGHIDDIHLMLARFWWGYSDSIRKLHWQKWEYLCKPKKFGGMEVRDLRVFNQELLAKQCWRLHHLQGTLLHSIFKAKYFKHCDILEAHRSYDPSYTWRSIRGAKSLLLDGLKWRIGNGCKVKV
ncbi:uncharacterized protein LOC110683931 [Chenopodium quinoa]|uniref:uncharacterized protein LOC110683931 n=1 Tax=Chenopodium quinoa TaxID=63459 RepID=UPI000B78AF45|nr:uncharacterized protein LOC110683931 [Chenopodium quinoa]